MNRRSGIRLATLLFAARLLAAEDGPAGMESVAAVTDVPELVAVTHYDIVLWADVDQNRLRFETTCTIRNQGTQALERMDFDLLATEQEYGANTLVDGVWVSDDSRRVACQFSHAARKNVGAPEQEGTQEFPKLLQVTLPSPLAVSAECRLRFHYSILVAQPQKKTDSGYWLISQLPTGEKEVCVMSDFSWIPRPCRGLARTISLGDRNFFSKGTKPSWRITLTHPASLESLVLDGRSVDSRRTNDIAVSSYCSVIGGSPQLLIGPCERIEVLGERISVVYLVPKRRYQRRDIENSARFLQRTYEFYGDLFGPLEGKPIHVAVSATGMGGHGAFLGMLLEMSSVHADSAFDEDAAHELAHSWWGDSVSSYGRGTKFLRESLCNFAAWHLGRSVFQRDVFREEAVRLFGYDRLAKPLFNATDDHADQAYNKGPFVLEQLRREMGDEIFFAVLRGFACRFRNGHASFTDFVAACNELSRRDWLPFLMHWCYGQGQPVYHLVCFESTQTTNGWQTSVTLTNAGRGIVTCPVELQTGAGLQRESFAVPESEARVFVWHTPNRVTNVVVDPDHVAFQGDAEEVRQKLRVVPEAMVSDTWLLYWMGAAHGDAGDYPRAEALLSQAIDRLSQAKTHGLLKGPMPISMHAYCYSRGVVRLRTGQVAQATEDLRRFLDGVLQPEEKSPTPIQEVTAGLAYARLIAGTPEARLEQLSQLLRQITGAEVPMDVALAEWRQWWKAHRTSFQPGPKASRLSPGAAR